MSRTIIVLLATILITHLVNGQEDSFKEVILINGTAYLAELTPKGDILQTYQKIDNYFSSTESHKNLVTRLSRNPEPSGISIILYESEQEPIPSFTAENKKPVTTENDQYIGFSPDRALLLKAAVDQIRRIAKSHRDGGIALTSITSYHIDDYRSRSLARNRAKAIKDLLHAFGVKKDVVSFSLDTVSPDTKVDFVRLSFSN